MGMHKPWQRQPAWVKQEYDIWEAHNKTHKHKMLKKEFMKGFLRDGERYRVSEGSGSSDGDIFDGTLEEPNEETR